MALSNALPHSIADLKRLAVRHHWRFALPCFLVPMAVLLGALFIPRQYEAEAIFERRNDLVMSEIAGRGAPQSFNRMKQGLSSELAGAPAIHKAIEDLRLIPAPPANADPAARQRYEIAKQDLAYHIQRNVRVIFEVSTAEVDRVRVAFTDMDPVRGRKVVNRLIENYLDSARKQVDGMLEQAAGFFDKQVASARAEIEQMETKKLRFEIENRDLLPNETGGFARSLPEAEDREASARQAHAAALKRVETLTKEMRDLDAAPAATVVKRRNPEIAQIEERLREYRNKAEQAIVIQKMTEKHPNVVALRTKIAELEAQLKAMPEEVISERVYGESQRRTQVQMAMLDAKAALERAAEELAMATKQTARLRDQNSQFFPVRAEYRRLERSIEESQRRMKFWEDNLHRVKVALTAELGQRGINMNFLKPCDPIQRPTSPSFMQILFAAALLGIACGFLWVLLSEQSDDRFDAARPVQAPLDVPVLGSVSRIDTPAEKIRRGLAYALGYPAAGAVMAALLLGAVYLNYTSLRLPRDIQAELASQQRPAAPALAEAKATPANPAAPVTSTPKGFPNPINAVQSTAVDPTN